MCEEMLRVPMAMRFPGRIAPGRESQALVSNLDVGPTLLDSAGLAFNAAVRDGRISAPIAIGRDHLDCGSVASPNRETEGMRDGTDAIAERYIEAVLQVFDETGTLWENLAPDARQPGDPAQPDFCGWAGLGSVAIPHEFLGMPVAVS